MDAADQLRPATMTGRAPSALPEAIPFDTDKLDALLEEAGIDVLMASSKHNIQYLMGDYRYFFFDHFDAIGLSRYLPIVIYPRGRPNQAAYIGDGMESYERDLGRFWMPQFDTASGSVGAMRVAIDHLRRLGAEQKTIGVERGFLPADAESLLRSELPGCRIVDAQFPLERLRAVKSPRELEYVRQASERVVESMLSVIAGHGPGTSKRALVEALRREEVGRGLTFEYCLITAGTSVNRAPSDQLWEGRDILSLDSGGNYKGYIGDLCRMAILGEPDSELEDLLAEIDEIQQAARKPIRAGTRGGDVIAAAEGVLHRSPNGNLLEFVAHGMGLISHEAPRLTDRAPIPYPAYDADYPLAAGMVLSIETTLPHPRRGFVKLEDTVVVTDSGWEAFGDSGRGWNRGGTRA